MGSNDGQPTPFEMIGDKSRHPVGALPVERGGRFVQKPDRPWRHEKPAKRQPPDLTGRQETGPEISGVIEPRLGQCRIDKGAGTTIEIGPEGEVVVKRQIGLKRRQMREEVQIRSRTVVIAAPMPNDLALVIEKTGKAHQKRGFAGTVRAGQHQRLTRSERDVETGKNLPGAAMAPQGFDGQATDGKGFDARHGSSDKEAATVLASWKCFDYKAPIFWPFSAGGTGFSLPAAKRLESFS